VRETDPMKKGSLLLFTHFSRTLDLKMLVPHYSTMAKHSDTLTQIQRLNGGLAWKRVEALLRSL
jgi:hypothetical protein